MKEFHTVFIHTICWKLYFNTLCNWSHEKVLFANPSKLWAWWGVDPVLKSCLPSEYVVVIFQAFSSSSFSTENPRGSSILCLWCMYWTGPHLAALVMRISCHTDCCQHSQEFLKDQESSRRLTVRMAAWMQHPSISVRRHRRFERTLNKNVFASGGGAGSEPSGWRSGTYHQGRFGWMASLGFLAPGAWTATTRGRSRNSPYPTV